MSAAAAEESAAALEAAETLMQLVSNVPHLTDYLSEGTRRFIYLVDEFYDRGVKLILTSEDTIIELYSGDKLAFEIERTRSRLLEMQSDDYLNEAHRQIQAEASKQQEEI